MARYGRLAAHSMHIVFNQRGRFQNGLQHGSWGPEGIALGNLLALHFRIPLKSYCAEAALIIAEVIGSGVLALGGQVAVLGPAPRLGCG